MSKLLYYRKYRMGHVHFVCTKVILHKHYFLFIKLMVHHRLWCSEKCHPFCLKEMHVIYKINIVTSLQTVSLKLEELYMCVSVTHFNCSIKNALYSKCVIKTGYWHLYSHKNTSYNLVTTPSNHMMLLILVLSSYT